MYVMGIDGGASTVRVLITDPHLVVYSQTKDTGVNPSALGQHHAALRMQTSIRRALADAGRQPADIAAVGVGVAGAPEAWCAEVIRGVLPDARVICAGDCEIALVGARGRRQGVLVLSGTGSVACGVNDAGEKLVIGGRGYLLGDEGSGYWLGKEALRRSLRAIDGLGGPTRLVDVAFTALQVTSAAELVRWVYDSSTVDAIARLAPLVLDAAAAGDAVAQEIVEQGAQELALLGRVIMQRLQMGREAVAFAGGLLTRPNPLSLRLCALLGLDAIPMPRYPPVMGAALLALQVFGEQQRSTGG